MGSTEDDLRAVLGPYLVEHHPPGEEGFCSVKEEGLRKMAARQGQSLAQVMIAALDQGLWPERFRPQRGTLTAAQQARLLSSTVAVIGLGGLGGTVTLLLARFGIGTLILCDGDTFEESNLNRQALATLSRLGQNKAQAAAEELAGLSPAVQVRPFPFMANQTNLSEILSGAQVVVDCLDNLPARYLLEKAARDQKTPFIHGAVAGLEGFVLTVFPDDPGLTSLYGPTAAPKEDSAETLLGVPTMTPNLIASLQVTEVVKILLGWEPLARGRLVHLDLSLPALETMRLEEKDPSRP